MKKLLILGITAIALTAAVAAQAASGLGLRGETGLARTPATVALPPMTLAVAADFVASDDTFIPLRAEFGVVEGLEVGGNYWYLDTDGDATVWGLNAKYAFPQFVEHLGLAVGGHYRKQTINDFENDGHDIYFAGSYAFGFLVPTVGVRYESITGDNDETDIRFFGSLVANILPNLAFGMEIESASDKLDGTNADPAMWFGARYMPMEGLTVQAGLLNYADIGAGLDAQKDFVLHFGAQYAFSFAR
jgi:hypothetical protein